MRLLVITQKVDRNDPVLGFFHRWIEEFAKHCEKVTVICLEMREHRLPINVRVLSLGKEQNKSKLKYIFRFYRYIWQERNNYDVVFVHMNQEYVLLGGLLWKLLHKKVSMWRNHAKGGLWTCLAVLLSGKVFCTSPHSFTARFKKTTLMPVGIDTDFFKPDASVSRVPNSVLFLGRIAPVKKVLEFVEWFNTLDIKFRATIAGAALAKDKKYEELVRRTASDRIKFIGPVSQEVALKLYQTHEIYVNKTPAGSFDKTIIEALACGMKIIVDNPDAKDIKIEDHSLQALFFNLEKELS